MELHFDGSFRAEIGLHNLLETLGGVDIHGQGLEFTEDFGARVDILDRCHSYSNFQIFWE